MSSRRALVWLLGTAAVAVLAVLGWRIFDPSAAGAPSPTVFETAQLMSEWRQYANAQPASAQDRQTPGEVVELMNTHVARAFPERRLSFLLWLPGMPPPPGYTPNPSAQRWPEGGKLPQPTRRTLRGQTDSLLSEARFRILVMGETAYVFPRDAFVPHLITRHLVPVESMDSPATMGYKVDLKWLLENQGIDMGPGKSVMLAATEQSLTICVDEADLERALQACKGYGFEESTWKGTKRKWRALRDKARRGLFGWWR